MPRIGKRKERTQGGTEKETQSPKKAVKGGQDGPGGAKSPLLGEPRKAQKVPGMDSEGSCILIEGYTALDQSKPIVNLFVGGFPLSRL